MLQKSFWSIQMGVLGIVLTMAVGTLQQVVADDSSSILNIDLITSDDEILEDDGLAYKLLVTNQSRSAVIIAGPRLNPRFLCLIECRFGRGEWQEVWDDLLDGRKRDVLPAPIQIASGATWAEYGQVFHTKESVRFFRDAGMYEMRAKVTCAIGVFLSEPKMVNVISRPKHETLLDTRYNSLGHRVLSGTIPSLEEHLYDLQNLCKRHQKGGVAKSLKLFLDVESFEKDGAVAGKATTRAEAFEVLSPGLDEVRRDQLAFLLGNGARKAKQWKDVEAILPEIKVESSHRRSLQGQLDSAIQTGAYRGR